MSIKNTHTGCWGETGAKRGHIKRVAQYKLLTQLTYFRKIENKTHKEKQKLFAL